MIRWHRDVNLPGAKMTMSLEKPSKSGNKDCLHGIRIRRFGEHRRPYDRRWKFMTTKLPGVCCGNEVVI